MIKWLKRMLCKRKLQEQERRWIKQIGLLTHCRIIRKDGSRMPMNLRVSNKDLLEMLLRHAHSFLIVGHSTLSSEANSSMNISMKI